MGEARVGVSREANHLPTSLYTVREVPLVSTAATHWSAYGNASRKSNPKSARFKRKVRPSHFTKWPRATIARTPRHFCLPGFVSDHAVLAARHSPQVQNCPLPSMRHAVPSHCACTDCAHTVPSFLRGFAPSAARLRSTWARRGHCYSSALKWSVRMRVYPSVYASPNAPRTKTPRYRGEQMS